MSNDTNNVNKNAAAASSQPQISQEELSMLRQNAQAVKSSETASMYVDTDLNITFANAATIKLVTQNISVFQTQFPGVDFGNLIGANIDAFHVDPSVQRRILGDPKNLPHQAEINVGDMIFEINVSAMVDPEGNHIGSALEWSDVTVKKAADNRAESLFSMIEAASTHFMTCDADRVINYCNPAVISMLRPYQADLRNLFPGFDVDNLVGTCIDIFHKNPAHQASVLGNPANLPAKAEITVGGLEFGVNATALLDADGNMIGNGVEWTDLNERAKYREEVGKVIKAASVGDLTVRGDADRLDEVYAPMMTGVNDIIDAVEAPISEAGQVLQELANADFRPRMEGEYEGSFDDMKANFNNAVDSLNKTMLQVSDSAGQVSAGATQITEGAQKLAEGASTQASSIEEISASLEQMTAMTKQNADNATQANNLSKEATDTADKGNSAMEKMEDAINRIKDSSDETAKIVKTIDEIAFQTNLLALNAAVEAARAGDAGKGFAVVAEEVRSLAQRSAEAAKNTASLIEGAGKNAESGVTITEQVREILGEIVGGSAKVNDLIGEIAAASNEQADGIRQVTEAIASMDRVTQENSANSEESSAAAVELNEQAGTLNQLINEFELANDGSVQQQPVQAAAARPVAAAPKRPAPSRARKANAAASIIPLDDADMSDF
jgi:methyl-accepting chemotaxis protein